MLTDHARAMVDAGGTMPDRVRSIDYADLMAQPGREVIDVLESLSLPIDRDLARSSIADYLAAQRSGKREKPLAQYDENGLTHKGVLGLPDFAQYVATFGVSVEEERVTDPVS